MKILIGLLIYCLFWSTVYAEQYKLRVVDKDKLHRGLECDIKMIKADGSIVLVSRTNKDGWTEIDFSCESLSKIVFVPKGDYYNKEITCPVEEKEIRLASIYYGRTLVKNAHIQFAKGNYGASALAFNEAHARISKHDKDASVKLEKELYISVGKVLEIETPIVYDHVQQKYVMTPELKSAVEYFQQNNNLNTTGSLDFKTLRTMSDSDISPMMFNTISPNM